jgi:hypothetical protein
MGVAVWIFEAVSNILSIAVADKLIYKLDFRHSSYANVYLSALSKSSLNTRSIAFNAGKRRASPGKLDRVLDRDR